MTNDEIPDVIGRYLRAADVQDIERVAACFTPEGFVIDENQKYVGHDEIVRWREELLGKFTYTSTLTGTEPGPGDEHRAFVRVEGNFPGGVVDLTFRFIVHDDLISALTIGG